MGMLASVPGHPIWDVVIDLLKDRAGGRRCLPFSEASLPPHSAEARRQPAVHCTHWWRQHKSRLARQGPVAGSLPEPAAFRRRLCCRLGRREVCAGRRGVNPLRHGGDGALPPAGRHAAVLQAADGCVQGHVY